MGGFANDLEINGASFELVCVRRSGVAVYRGDGAYLRLGHALTRELEVHRRMLELGYPVADILAVGEHAGTTYVIEASLGAHTLGDLYAERTDDGPASAGEFSMFLEVMRRWTRAQLRGARRQGTEHAEFLGVARTVENVPALADQVRAAFTRAGTLLGELPGTLQHGDLHAFNTCPLGVIDLEGAGWGPAGYDVATAVLEPTLAAGRWDEDGRLHLSWYTSAQIGAYLEMLDGEFRDASPTPPSSLIDAYVVCRAISMCSRVHRDAGVQAGRQRVLGQLLPHFLDGGPLPIVLAP